MLTKPCPENLEWLNWALLRMNGQKTVQLIETGFAKEI